jgi:ABC-type lipoprotein release transport system permease subunit
MRVILAGGIVGVAGAWFLARMLASMLVGVEVHDPASLFLAWALMTLVALLGTSLPALGAARTNPTSVLYSE